MLVQFLHIAGGDDAGGQRDHGDAEQGGNHRDDSADCRDWIDVSIADGGQGDGRPVNRFEEIVVGGRLHVEYNERRNQDVSECQPTYGEQRPPGALEHAQNDFNASGVAQRLKYAQHARRAGDSQQAQNLEPVMDHHQGGEDRNQIDDGHEGEGIAQKGYGGAPSIFEVGGAQPQQIVNDECAGANEIQKSEKWRVHLERQRNETEQNQKEHQIVIESANEILSVVPVNNLKNPLAHRESSSDKYKRGSVHFPFAI